MSVSAPASWSKSQNPYRTTPARRQRRHLVSLRDVRSQTPSVGERSGLAVLASGPRSTAASPPSTATTPLCRRARELSDIDPKYVSQSGLCLSSDMETSRGSIRIQHLTGTRPPVGEPRFPKLEECAHFHYEVVELGPLLVQLYDEELKCSVSHASDEEPSSYLSLQVTSFGRSWVLRRTYDNLRLLDTQLHQCVYDRKYSCLPELPLEENLEPVDDSLQVCYVKEELLAGHVEAVEALVADYLHRFSQIAGPLINCAPILNWFELDNRGNRLLVADDSDINTPAVAAALVGKRYVAQASDEISLEVGDMISVIDMAPPDESVWWRGKRGFEVGFFPCECVELIGEKVPQQLEVSVRTRRSATLQPSRPVLRKHGKLIAFFRSFIQTRPSRRKLKQSGILKERVFGCDLGEHLMNTGRDIPVVLRSCAEFIEAHGIVDGIYRLSGVNSNIQRLRNTFDEDRVPDLADPSVRQDIHSVSCLLKQYLRELPNPLLTYQLYDKFVSAVQSCDDQRLLRMRDVVQQLPPPHYRTLEYLIRHLSRVSSHGHNTGMTPKNLAIVWAPNLVRSKELEVGGVAALQGVGIQAVVVEYLIRYCELIFSDKLPAFCPELAPQTRTPKRSRPKSLAISTPTKLLSLEEARSRALGVSAKADQKYIEVGGGPSQLPTKYHTVIALPQRKSGSLKFRRSPIGWRSLFRGRPAKSHQRKGSEPIDIGLTDKTLTESDLTQSRVRTRRLRSVKSADSLVSLYHSESKRSCMLQLDSSPSPVTLPASAPAADSLALRSCSESDTPETDPSVRAHARSVSHDSYFNNLLELKLPFCDAEERLEEEDEELQTQYCFDDSDMRVFSEDETMRASDSSKGRIRQLTSPPRVRRATRSEEGGVKRTATGSFRDKVLSALSPGARRRAEEAAAEAGGSPRVKVRKKASVETLTCSESTSVDVSSLRTDGSAGGVLSEGETLSPPPPAGRQVVAEVHVSPEPSTCQDIILLSPISECTASSAEHYGRPSASSPAEDVTEHDVSEIVDSDGALTPAADANRISTLVPEALELLDRRLNSESFRRAVADAAAGGDESDADADDAAYENVSPVDAPGETTPCGEDADRSYEPILFRSAAAAGADGVDAGMYENAAFASSAEVWQPRSGPAPAAADGDELVYENVSPPPPDAVYQQVRVFRNSLQQVNALVGGGGGGAAGELAAALVRRSFVEAAAAPAADGSSPTRSCPVFSDGSPSPTDVRYSQLSSSASSPDRRLVSADITTAATCSDTLDDRPLPSEAEMEASSAAEVELEAPAAAEVELEAPAATEVELEAPAAAEVELEAPAATEVELEAPAATEAVSVAGLPVTALDGGLLTAEVERPDMEDMVTPVVTEDGWGVASPAVTPPPPMADLRSPDAAGDRNPAPDRALAAEGDGSSEGDRELPSPLIPAPEAAETGPASRPEQRRLAAEVCEDLMAECGDEAGVREADTALRLSGAEVEGGQLPQECRVSDTADVYGPSDEDSARSPEEHVSRAAVFEEPTPVSATDLGAAPETVTAQGVCIAPGETFPHRDLLHLGFPASQDAVSPDREASETLLSPSPLPPPPGALSAEDRQCAAEVSGVSGPESPPPASPLRPAGDSGLGTPDDGFVGAARPSPSPSDVSTPACAGQDGLLTEGSVTAVVAEPLVTVRPVEVTDESPVECVGGGDGAAELDVRTALADGDGDRACRGVTLTAEEAAVTRPRAARDASAPVSVPGREAERRAAGARAAASWPAASPADGGGGGCQRGTEPAPAWLRSDLRRLSDRRASVKQLLSKFEVKEEGDEDEEGDVFLGAASESPANTAEPERESERVSRKTSLPERPRYLFSPKPFQRQLSDQTTVRSRPEPTRTSPLVSPASGAPVRITENPLHAATERLARSAAEPGRSPTERLARSAAEPGRSPTERLARSAAEPGRSPTERLARSAAEPGRSPTDAPPRTNGVPVVSPASAPATAPERPAADRAPSSPLSCLRVGSVPSQQLRVGSVSSRLSDAEGSPPSPAASATSNVTTNASGTAADDAPVTTAAGAPSTAAVSSPAADDESQDGHHAHSSVVEGRLVVELDANARERIERYKQERRSLLREKFKTESFKREKTEVMQELRRPESERRADETSQSPSPTRRDQLRRSDSEVGAAAERRAARPAVVSAPPAAAPFRRAASLRSPSQETAAPLTAAPAAPVVSPSASVNDRLAAARERVSQLKSQEVVAAQVRSPPTSRDATEVVVAAQVRSPPTSRDPTEEVNVREQVAGWSRGQQLPATAAGRRTPAAVSPTTPTRLAPRSQLPDPGKIRNIAAKFEETAEGARKNNYVSTV